MGLHLDFHPYPGIDLRDLSMRRLMGDRFLFEIGDNWGLGYDSLQWILLRSEKSARRGKKSHPPLRWRAVSFIASTRDILLRRVEERGIRPTPEGWAALNSLPDTFTDWRRHQSDLAKAA